MPQLSLMIDTFLACFSQREISSLENDCERSWKGRINRIKNFNILLFHLNDTFLLIKAQGSPHWLLKAIKKTDSFFRVITSSSLEVIASLIESGAGIGILPSSVARINKLQPKPNTPVYHDEICLVYRHENRHIKSMQTMVKAIKECVI